MDRIVVLIPCYNEEQTIEKVVSDWKKSYRKQKFMYIIIIHPIIQRFLQNVLGRLSKMNTSRAKVT